MKAGDRLVAVAGESVDGLGHEETVSRIRAQGSCVSLVVVDPEADRFFSMVRDWVGERVGMGEGLRSHRFSPRTPQVRLSPLLFLENTEIAAAPLAETKDLPVEDTVEPSGFAGSRQCFLYPGPGGGYGFRLRCVASGPCLFVSQVIGCTMCLGIYPSFTTSPLPRSIFPALEHLTNPFVYPPTLPGDPRRLSCTGRAADGRCDFGGERMSCGWRQ